MTILGTTDECHCDPSMVWIIISSIIALVTMPSDHSQIGRPFATCLRAGGVKTLRSRSGWRDGKLERPRIESSCPSLYSNREMKVKQGNMFVDGRMTEAEIRTSSVQHGPHPY
jgi:hypothetical protein